MTDINEAAQRIIVALDVDHEKEAYDLGNPLPPISYYKVGMRLYTAWGPVLLRA